MKKLIVVGGVLLFVFALSVSLTLAKSDNAQGPHQKATGDVWFSTPWGNVHVNFNAHRTDPAKGWMYWERLTGYTNWWAGPVVLTDVNDNVANFTVRVEEGATAVVGCDVTFQVIDNGSPASSGDSINITAVKTTPGKSCAAVNQTQGPYSGSDFYAGNLVVHD